MTDQRTRDLVRSFLPRWRETHSLTDSRVDLVASTVFGSDGDEVGVGETFGGGVEFGDVEDLTVFDLEGVMKRKEGGGRGGREDEGEELGNEKERGEFGREELEEEG